MGHEATSESHTSETPEIISRVSGGKKRLRGQNLRKNRKPNNTSFHRRVKDICKSLIDEDGCFKSPNEEDTRSICKCDKIHSLEEYLRIKVYLEGPCPNFDKYGYCRYGIRCVFSKNHTIIETVKGDNGESIRKSSREIVTHRGGDNPVDYQYISRDFQKLIRSSSSNILDRSKEIVKLMKIIKEGRSQMNDNETDDNEIHQKEDSEVIQSDYQNGVSVDESILNIDQDMNSPLSLELSRIKKWFGEVSCNSGTLVLKEKLNKPLDLKGKTYLAPLTTLGNLPFRRLCKILGADVTCSEMAMCYKLLQGNDHEWALLRRHKSEDIYGVQICGGFPNIVAQCAEAIEKSDLKVDFIDLNAGCPLALVTKSCAGSALLGCKRRLLDVCSAADLATTVPITVKLRQGLRSDKPLALSIIHQLKSTGVSLATLHGRSKEQRYTKSADWEYIAKCSAEACSGEKTLQLFGNGDVINYSEYYLHLEEDKNLAGIMIGRGALIKPWIFTEIKEHRNWDISSRERLDILRQLCNYGLEYWGSDDIGVDVTRRMLCEWQSFMCRYVPIGITEVLPQKMNVRPQKFCGRDDLEILMASTSSKDWVKISEMLLGRTPEHFIFIPKHNSSLNELEELKV